VFILIMVEKVVFILFMFEMCIFIIMFVGELRREEVEVAAT